MTVAQNPSRFNQVPYEAFSSRHAANDPAEHTPMPEELICMSSHVGYWFSYSNNKNRDVVLEVHSGTSLISASQVFRRAFPFSSLSNSEDSFAPSTSPKHR